MICGEYPKKYFLGYFNSRIPKWFLDTASSSLWWNSSIFQKSVFITIPIPEVTNENSVIISDVEFLVEKILINKNLENPIDTEELEERLNLLTYKLYNLTPEEIAIVEGNP